MIEPQHMIESEEAAYLHNTYYHKMTLKSGKVVIGESPIGPQAAAWDAQSKLHAMFEQENGELYE